MPANTPTVHLRQFPGLNNQDDPAEYGLAGMEAAENVDLTKAGKIKRRPGRVRVYSGTIDSAVVVAGVVYFQTASTLYRLEDDYTATALRTGLTSVTEGALVAVEAAGDVFLTNGHEQVCVSAGAAKRWGVPNVERFNVDTMDGGQLLDAGTVLVAVTNVADGGLESGALIATPVPMVASQRLRVTFTEAAPSEVSNRNVYLSTPDGAELFYAGSAPAAASTWEYSGYGNDLRWPLSSWNLSEPPAGGRALCLYRGAVYMAVDDTLYCSDTMAYHHFDLRRYIQFDDPITILAPVTDGIYVGTDGEIVFLAGRLMADMERVQVANYGAYRGSFARANPQRFGASGEAVMFLSTQGMCSGLNGGAFTNHTQGTFHPPSLTLAAAGMREDDGQARYIVSASE